MSAAYGEHGAVLATTGEARARVSWSAIFSGVVLVVAVQVLLSVLGAGVGLGMVNLGHADSASASSLGIGAGIWWVVSTVLSLVAGSFVAARLAGVGTRFDGVLHGLVIWGLTLLLTVYLISSAVGGLIGGAFSAIGTTVSAAGSAVGGAASTVGDGLKASTGVNVNMLQQQTENLLRSQTPQDPASMSAADAAKAVAQSLPDMVAGGDKAAAAKQRITAIVAAQAKISPQDAQKRVDDAQAQFEQSKQQAIDTAKQAADQSAAAASRGSFLAFVGLLIGGLAAAVGGSIASPRIAAATGRFR